NSELEPVHSATLLVFRTAGTKLEVSNLEQSLAARKCFQLVHGFLQLVPGARLQTVVESQSPFRVGLVERKPKFTWAVLDHVLRRKVIRDAHVLRVVAMVGRVERPSPVASFPARACFIWQNLNPPPFLLDSTEMKCQRRAVTKDVIVLFFNAYFA